MKVKELVHRLQREDQDKEVKMRYAPLSVANIDDVRQRVYYEDIQSDEEIIIVLENNQLKNNIHNR